MNVDRACLNCGTKYLAEPQERCCSQQCRSLLEEKEVRLEQLRNEHSRLIEEERKALDEIDMETFELIATDLARVRREFFTIACGIVAQQVLPAADDIIH